MCPEDAQSQALRFTATRGDRIAIVWRIDGNRSDALDALVDALDGATWLAQIRDAEDTLIATFTATQTLVSNVLTITFALDDSTDLEVDTEYFTDFEVHDDSPMAPYTFADGSTIEVTQDRSAA